MNLAEELAKQGPLGLICLAEAYALVRLYNDLKTATTKQAETAERALQVVQSAREESKQVQGLLASMLDVLRQLPPKRS